MFIVKLHHEKMENDRREMIDMWHAPICILIITNLNLPIFSLSGKKADHFDVFSNKHKIQTLSIKAHLPNRKRI